MNPALRVSPWVGTTALVCAGVACDLVPGWLGALVLLAVCVGMDRVLRGAGDKRYQELEAQVREQGKELKALESRVSGMATSQVLRGGR
jgi:hypothetical protein